MRTVEFQSFILVLMLAVDVILVVVDGGGVCQ